jgi:hypothetical protein
VTTATLSPHEAEIASTTSSKIIATVVGFVCQPSEKKATTEATEIIAVAYRKAVRMTLFTAEILPKS